MSYNVKIGDNVHEINADYPNIAYSSVIVSDAKFNPSTFYADTFSGMPNDGNYVKTTNELLYSTWGKQSVIDVDHYNVNGSPLTLADKQSCPTPHRPSSSNNNTDVTTWGNLRYASGTVLFALLENKMKVSTDNGRNYTIISDFPHGYHTLLFLDVVGGGGAGGGAAITYWHGPCGGGGGGAGAFCTCVIDMSKIDLMSITIGSGGTVQEGGIAKPGTETTITLSKNGTTKTLVCGGGNGGGRGSDDGYGGTPGTGGRFTSSFNLDDNLSGNSRVNDDLRNYGIVYLNWFHGKSGGYGKDLNSHHNATVGESFKHTEHNDRIKSSVISTTVPIGTGATSGIGVGGSFAEKKKEYPYSEVAFFTGGGGGGASALSRGNGGIGAGGRGHSAYNGLDTDKYDPYDTSYDNGGSGYAFISYKWNLS